MNYDNFATFTAKQTSAILTVTFNFSPVNIQGVAMINDLDRLAEGLEQDNTVKVVVFESAVPDFFIAHADEALKEETYQLYQSTSQTPAIKRFTVASETDFQNNLHNQNNFQTLLMGLQEIK